jgi:hypothetical protein
VGPVGRFLMDDDPGLSWFVATPIFKEDWILKGGTRYRYEWTDFILRYTYRQTDYILRRKIRHTFGHKDIGHFKKYS